MSPRTPTSSGRSSARRSAAAPAWRAYYAEHREEELARIHAYQEQHREEMRRRSTAYYETHKAEAKARQQRRLQRQQGGGNTP